MHCLQEKTSKSYKQKIKEKSRDFKVGDLKVSKFLRVQCNKCGKERIIFGDAKMIVKCDCGEILSKPRGGRANIKCKILEVL